METRQDKDREDTAPWHGQTVPTPATPADVRLAPEDVHYWNGLTPREQSIWSAGWASAESAYGVRDLPTLVRIIDEAVDDLDHEEHEACARASATVARYNEEGTL